VNAFDDAQLAAELKRHFGFSSFRAGQLEVIRSVLEGQPTLAVMPTGGGKSLCYQLPAMLLPGIAVVVSPLIALMKDQVDALEARGIPATFVNSSLAERERQDRSAAIAAGTYKLVFLAPERFRSPRFLAVLKRTPISLFAVDEAHCISQWGHDFRPDYARLGEARALLQAPRTLALTATATPDVRRQICEALRLENPRVFVAALDRPNLMLEVAKVRGRREKVSHLLELAREGSGIAYVATRREAERIAGELGANGVRSLCYHAGMSDAERRATQEAFLQSHDTVVVATSAFGMGVDKPDVRFIAHVEIPRSIEAYYQEIGRAGRDGAPAIARLLFNHGDVFLQQRMIVSSCPDEILLRDLWRHLSHARATPDAPASLAALCGARESQAAAAIRLLEEAGHLERIAPNRKRLVIELLRPLAMETLDPRARAQRAVAGALGRLLPRSGGEEAEVDLDELAAASELSPDAARRALIALESSGALFFRQMQAERQLRVVDPGLPPERLRVDLRQVLWQKQHALGLLRQMTRYAYARSCRRQMLLRHFGETAAGTCAGCDNCREHPVRARPPRRAGAPGSREASFSMFASGLSVEQVADERGLSAETVRRHLAEAITEGRRFDVLRVVSAGRTAMILEAIRTAPPFLEAIKQALPPDFLFGEIIVVLAARRAGLIDGTFRPDSEAGAGAST
jgi:ATP-dependent DNA helicase RecQ